MKMNINSEEDDDDIFAQDTLKDVFPSEYHLSAHCSVGLDKSYIMHLDLKSDSSLAVGLSNHNVAIFDTENVVRKTTFKAHSKKLTGVKISPQNVNLVYTGSLDQTIKLWDLRNGSSLKPVLTFAEEKTTGHKKEKPLTTFDVNCSDMFIAAGTEQVMNDSFLLFWDVRKPTLIGGYWDTFGDEVTDVKFHPENPDTIVTGGADSTINVFDISCSSEDEALVTSTAIESSVNGLTWFPRKGKWDNVAVVTDDNQISLWCTEDPGPKVNLTREDISLGLRRKSPDWCYVVGTHFSKKSDQLYVVGGSSCPSRPCLRILSSKKQKLKPFSDFSDKAVRNAIVRASVFDEKSDAFFTGSEEGFICCWKPGMRSEGKEGNTKMQGKVQSSIKQKKISNPY